MPRAQQPEQSTGAGPWNHEASLMSVSVSTTGLQLPHLRTPLQDIGSGDAALCSTARGRGEGPAARGGRVERHGADRRHPRRSEPRLLQGGRGGGDGHDQAGHGKAAVWRRAIRRAAANRGVSCEWRQVAADELRGSASNDLRGSRSRGFSIIRPARVPATKGPTSLTAQRCVSFPACHRGKGWRDAV